MKQYTPEQIIEIMHSIKNVALDEDGCIEVRQYDDKQSCSIRSFEPDSFTHELLELIEAALSE